jgi:OOP family OmpA-OmpF porin
VKTLRILLAVLVAGLFIGLLFSGCATKEPAVAEKEPEKAESARPEKAPEAPAAEEPEEVAMAEEQEPTARVVMRDSDGDGVPDDKDRCPNTPAGMRVDQFGCPKTEGGMVEIQLTLQFDFDSFKIRDEYLSERYKIDQFMAANPEAELVRVDLDGHTCNIGRKSYNYKLSRQRAEEVQRYLMKELGVGRDYFRINAYGEDRPVASNDTLEGRRKNRRVDVVFVVKNVKL